MAKKPELFARIMFASNGEQVLITKNFDNENEEVPYYLNLRADFKGLCGEISLGYKTLKEMRKEFTDFSQDSVDKFYNAVAQFKP